MEYGYIKWCTEVGVSAEMLSRDSRKRFCRLLNWVGEKPEIRESLVKTGEKAGVKSGESLLSKWLENNIIIGKKFARLSAF